MRFLVSVFLVTFAGSAVAQSAYTTQKEKFSYALGHQLGQSLARDDLELDRKALLQAIEDVLSGSEPKVPAAEMQAAVQTERDRRAKEQQAAAAANQEKGDKFLSENKAKEGVKATESGLQYKVLTDGEGPKPTETDTVVVHYRGTLIDGTEFDSSYARNQPTTLPLNGVIKGWQEGLKLMGVGSKYQLYIPAGLAYGPRGAGSKIGPNETLVFDVELLEIK